MRTGSGEVCARRDRCVEGGGGITSGICSELLPVCSGAGQAARRSRWRYALKVVEGAEVMRV